MQTDGTDANSATTSARPYDANSAKTIENQHIEWLQVGRKRKQASEPIKSQNEMPKQDPKPTPQPSKQRNQKMPPFPTDDFKIVYRPQVGLDLSKWNLTAVTHAIGRSSGLTQQDFHDNVRVQTQRVENVIIASTADTERATKLKSITTIQLGGTFFKVNPHVRHPDDVSRGVIYGLLPGTSSAEIVAGLRVDSRYTVLGARMLGRSSTAVITFDGPHVPYYITYQSGDYRCKPYRKSVQYCRTCGAIGHRQDICPSPRKHFCYKCGQDAVLEDHECLPKCKICEEAHETAGKECKKKLRPNPPPYQVRQQQLNKAKVRDSHWNLSSDDEFPKLENPSTSSGSAPRRHAGRSKSRSRSRSVVPSRSKSGTRSRTRSVQRVNYAAAARGYSHNTSASDFSTADTAALRALENIVRNQQKALQSLRDQIQSQGAVIDKLTQLCQEREEIIHKQNDNIEKLTQLCQEQQLTKQQAKNLTKQEVEAVVEEKIVHVIETKLEALIESKLTVIVESKLEAILQAKLQPIHTQIGNKFTTLSHTMDTHTAQINEMKSQLTNFIAHVKNNYMSHAELEEGHGRKKRRPHSKTPSRSNSLEREHVNAPGAPVDGKL